MAYLNRFNSVDFLITQLVPLTSQPGIDPMVLSSLAGIIAVEAVTAYELAIKDIFVDFSTKKHIVFGHFVQTTLDRLNGRIKYQDIKDTMVKSYGDKYLQKFNVKIKEKNRTVLATEHVDLIQTYDTLIIGRHSFVHLGQLTMTLPEAIHYYSIGKYLIAALDETMRR